MLLTVLGQSSEGIKSAVLAGASKVLKCVEAWVNEVIEASVAGDLGGSDGAEASQALLLNVLECLDSLPMDLATLKRTGIGRVAGSLRKPPACLSGLGRTQGDDVATRAKQLVEKWRRLADPKAGASMDGADAAVASKKAKLGVGRPLLVDVAYAKPGEFF